MKESRSRQTDRQGMVRHGERFPGRCCQPKPDSGPLPPASSLAPDLAELLATRAATTFNQICLLHVPTSPGTGSTPAVLLGCVGSK